MGRFVKKIPNKIVKHFTRTMEMFIWRAITIDYLQSMKSTLVKRSALKLAFQEAQACYHRCNNEGAMAHPLDPTTSTSIHGRLHPHMHSFVQCPHLCMSLSAYASNHFILCQDFVNFLVVQQY